MLLIVAGALVTRYFGVHGQVALAEGETVDYYRTPQDSLTIIARETGERASVNLVDTTDGVFHALSLTGGPSVGLDDLHVEVDRYLPDSTIAERIFDDGPDEHQAVEVALSGTEGDEQAWVFAGDRVGLGPTTVVFRVLRYMPHATVEPDNSIVNASSRPVNPAI